MYTPTNQERAVGLRKWADALLSNPDNTYLPKRYLEGIRRRALAQADTIQSQPDVVADEFGTQSATVPESFLVLSAQPVEVV